MAFTKTTEPNGLRIVTVPQNGSQAITVLIMAGAGSRYETAKINGVSHFLEHLFFKGAKRYPTPASVAQAVDGVGGEFNAFTGKEYAGYYIKVAKEQLHLCFDVLSDMLLNATFQPAELERERGVILEEINMYEDTPMAKVGVNFERLMFGDHPLGWDTAGPKDVIKQVTRDQILAYREQLYKPDNIVVCVSGATTHQEVEQLTREFFPFAQEKHTLDWKRLEQFPTERLHLQTKNTEQAHLILGSPGLSLTDDRRFAARVMGTILGGNMSSRMFQHIREQRGLCYYIHTSPESFMDTGYFATSAGVDLERIDEAVLAVQEEYAKIRDTSVTEEELTRAKEFIRGKVTLSFEDTEDLANFYCTQELLKNKIDEPAELLKKITAVTIDEVAAMAKELLIPSAMRLAVIGPYEDTHRFEKLLS